MTEIASIDQINSFVDTFEKSGGYYFVVKFYAPWCGPCKMMKSIYENISTDSDLKDIAFISINRDLAAELISYFGFQIPTIPRFFLCKVIDSEKFEIVSDLGGSQSKSKMKEQILNLTGYLTEKKEGIKKINMNETKKHRVAIVGSGPSGLTAGIYTARAALDVTIYLGSQPGGQLTTTTEIENFPFAWNVQTNTGVDGTELVTVMQKQAQFFGAKIEQSTVTSVEFNKNKNGNHGNFTVTDFYGEKQNYDGVIIASGASARYLGIPGEEKYIGRGYHSCATCDGSFYKDKIVAIVGGGDSCMEEAGFLTNFAKKVYLIHRSENFRASKIMLERAKNTPKIEFMTNCVISEIIGDKKVESVTIKRNDAEIFNFVLDGLFVAIGHDPNTKFVGNLLETDNAGYLIPNGRKPISERANIYNMGTIIPGLFVAGDVEDSVYRQAITAAGDGCRAAIEMERYLASS